MNKAPVLVVLALCLAGAAWAEPPPSADFLKLSPTEQEIEAPQVLQTKATPNEIWALGGVGFARARPLKYVAYEALLRRKDAAARFTELLGDSNALTQLYALKGLSLCAPETFRQVAPRFVQRTDLVLRGTGCLLLPVPFGQIVREMQTEPVVLLAPQPR